MSEPTLTEAALLAALDEVTDPDLGQSIVVMEMIKDIRIERDVVSLTCELTTPACPMKGVIESDIRETLARHFPHVKEWRVTMTGRVRGGPSGPAGQVNLLPQVRHVVLVASFKGGVGKSTVALNLALALGRAGARVGLLDLDLHGPSLHLLLGLRDKPQVLDFSRIKPLPIHGLEAMTLGLLVDPKQALLWRGTILTGLVEQFLRDVAWRESDYLLVDLPPGGAEAALALVAQVPHASAVVVTTPQAASAALATRTKALYDQLHVPVAGLIENLAGFARAEGGAPGAPSTAARLAEELQVPLLGSIPYDPELPAWADAAQPVMLRAPESAAGRAFDAAAKQLAAELSKRAAQPAAAPATPPAAPAAPAAEALP